jgi:hypothetical protein
MRFYLEVARSDLASWGFRQPPRDRNPQQLWVWERPPHCQNYFARADLGICRQPCARRYPRRMRILFEAERVMANCCLVPMGRLPPEMACVCV